MIDCVGPRNGGLSNDLGNYDCAVDGNRKRPWQRCGRSREWMTVALSCSLVPEHSMGQPGGGSGVGGGQMGTLLVRISQHQPAGESIKAEDLACYL